MLVGRRRLVRAGVAGLVLTALVAGCGLSGIKKSIDRINASASAYGELQSFIADQLTTKFHRSVRSVSCTPHVDEVVNDSSATMTCVVVFTDGSSYTTRGTVTNPNQDIDYATYDYSFTDPPPLRDITTAPLPRPAVVLVGDSPASLFVARNLAPVVRRLAARFGDGELIIQLALYPGELEAVIGANGTARSVSGTYSGGLSVGPATSFYGSRSGIDFSQLVPGVIQRLTGLIATRGGVPVARIGRFVLVSLPGDNAGWDIYLTSGTTRFRSLVLGGQLVMITPGGTRALGATVSG